MSTYQGIRWDAAVDIWNSGASTPYTRNFGNDAGSQYKQKKGKRGRRRGLCRQWSSQGSCSFGSRCNFVHGSNGKSSNATQFLWKEKDSVSTWSTNEEIYLTPVPGDAMHKDLIPFPNNERSRTPTIFGDSSHLALSSYIPFNTESYLPESFSAPSYLDSGSSASRTAMSSANHFIVSIEDIVPEVTPATVELVGPSVTVVPPPVADPLPIGTGSDDHYDYAQPLSKYRVEDPVWASYTVNGSINEDGSKKKHWTAAKVVQVNEFNKSITVRGGRTAQTLSDWEVEPLKREIAPIRDPKDLRYWKHIPAIRGYTRDGN